MAKEDEVAKEPAAEGGGIDKGTTGAPALIATVVRVLEEVPAVTEHKWPRKQWPQPRLLRKWSL